MKVLMCPPLHYQPAQGEDAPAIMAQWRGLYRLLRDELDVHVDLLEPRPGMSRLVLAASGGLVWEDAFIGSRFRDASRQREREAWDGFFLVRGYVMPPLPEGCRFEGERDLVVADGTLFAGYRSQADLAAHQAVSGILGREIHSLRLSDRSDGHLDGCLWPLGNGMALYHPEAFHPDARGTLDARLPGLRRADTGDARRLGCNGMVVGSHVILPQGCDATAVGLEQEGFRVHTLPLQSYARHGAGPKALVLRIEG